MIIDPLYCDCHCDDVVGFGSEPSVLLIYLCFAILRFKHIICSVPMFSLIRLLPDAFLHILFVIQGVSFSNETMSH